MPSGRAASVRTDARPSRKFLRGDRVNGGRTMKRSIILALALALALTGAAAAKPDAEGAAALAATARFTAVLTGAGEFPAAADATLVGFAQVTLDTTANTVT